MEYITIKTETWAHDKNSGAELHRFEIITRHWINDDGLYQWQHNIVFINREGVTKQLNDVYAFSGLWDIITQYMSKQPTTDKQYYPARVQMVEQHSWILLRLIG